MRTPAALVALLLAALSLADPGAAAAQGETTCDLAPVTLPLFDATPAATIVATPAASASAPAPTEEAMRAAAERIVACANDRAQSSRYAVFTDRYLAALFIGPDRADQPAFERMIATGTVPQPSTWRLDAVSDIVPQPDGRVAVTLALSSPADAVTDRVVLAWDADQGAWLIDEVLDLGTPAA